MVESYLVAFSSKKQPPAPPLGVVASITTGFDVVNKRLELIVLPLALDLFLWLGPRLSIKPLVAEMVALLSAPPGDDSAALAQALAAWRQLLTEQGERFNLFSSLSTSPLGVPSVMAGRGAAGGPLDAPLVWPVDDPLVYFFCFGVLILLGLLLGALYFGGIAQQVRDARLDWSALFRQVWGDWAWMTALAFIALAVLVMMGGPVLVLSLIFAIISPALGSVAAVLGLSVIVWVMIFGGFTLPGLLLQRRGLLGALWDSLRLVQSSLPQTAGLFATTTLLNFGLSLLWNLPADDSWFLGVGLAGHALVSTALAAALFVFYKDRYRFWMETQQALSEQAARA